MNLNHLHINVPEINEAKAFYARYFSFNLKFQHDEGVFLENKNGFLLALDPLRAPDKKVDFPSWFHFGFCLPEPKTVREIYARMKTDGVKFARELKEFGEDAVNFYCWAPGGYKLEVSWNRDEKEVPLNGNH